MNGLFYLFCDDRSVADFLGILVISTDGDTIGRVIRALASVHNDADNANRLDPVKRPTPSNASTHTTGFTNFTATATLWLHFHSYRL